ncbi:hypothetical protein EJB05_52571 [Eragrostis curvula]|uniref:Uncharacterized protein n=1 Tax=Eragrostis curvula TaxID=38414 RepID=A0A5J9SSM7_9POAL|nr:hypothetical protein EJB05_52571 [Eragrostis curvula]
MRHHLNSVPSYMSVISALCHANHHLVIFVHAADSQALLQAGVDACRKVPDAREQQVAHLIWHQLVHHATHQHQGCCDGCSRGDGLLVGLDDLVWYEKMRIRNDEGGGRRWEEGRQGRVVCAARFVLATRKLLPRSGLCSFPPSALAYSHVANRAPCSVPKKTRRRPRSVSVRLETAYGERLGPDEMLLKFSQLAATEC